MLRLCLNKSKRGTNQVSDLVEEFLGVSGGGCLAPHDLVLFELELEQVEHAVLEPGDATGYQ